jgi:hypothetical protein
MVLSIVVLVFTGATRSSVDLNITVHDLRHIPDYWVVLKNSLKNFAEEDFGVESASEGAFERLVSI